MAKSSRLRKQERAKAARLLLASAPEPPAIGVLAFAASAAHARPGAG